ncbi:MAG: hypothetical protein IT369_04625 [Candidatus Latescibacteria bacterium]|nr:hypothetical protein [Candidatus Latescibacterota bacterium]
MPSFSWLLPPIVVGTIAIAMVVLSIRSIRLYSRRAAEARRKLRGIDKEVAKWFDGSAGKRQAVADLELIVKPLQEQESRLQSYHKMLEVLSLGAEEKSNTRPDQGEKRDVKMASTRRQQEEQPKRKLEINLKKRGL